jgi:hypothetical protein
MIKVYIHRFQTQEWDLFMEVPYWFYEANLDELLKLPNVKMEFSEQEGSYIH